MDNYEPNYERPPDNYERPPDNYTEPGLSVPEDYTEPGATIPSREATIPNRKATIPNREATIPSREATIPNRGLRTEWKATIPKAATIPNRRFRDVYVHENATIQNRLLSVMRGYWQFGDALMRLGTPAH